jgi:hypothetical protein
LTGRSEGEKDIDVDVSLKETGDPRRRVPIMINKHIEPT